VLKELGFSAESVAARAKKLERWSREKGKGRREKNLGETFRELVVWQRSIQMTMAVYRLTSNFPVDERFGLTNQLRRASVSVASNIAEGYGRATTGEYVQFLGHARGSNCEVQTQLVIAGGLGFGSDEERANAEQLSLEVGRMLAAMMSKLQS